MKLRIQGNAIRLRLSESDLQLLESSGAIQESTRFPGNARFDYVLQSAAVDGIEARFDGRRLSILIPEAWVSGWSTSDREGFEASFPLPGDETLLVKIEKDLPCRHPRAEQPTSRA